MIVYTPTEILNSSKASILTIPKGKYKILYPDKEVECTDKTVIFNRYIWEMFTFHPSTPIDSRCCVSSFISVRFNSKTHIRILEYIFNYISTYNHLLTYSSKEHLLKCVFTTVNDIHNDIILGASDMLTTLSAMDFVNVVNCDAIKEIHSQLEDTAESIDRAYRGIREYMNSRTGDDVNTNRFIKAFQTKAVKENQAIQCIGPRGFIPDLDRTVFSKPIKDGFIRGMSNLYNLMIESRTAAKSLNATESDIRTSEYASRRIQILCMPIRRIVIGDCGTKQVFDLYVTKNLLPNLKGVYYLKDDTTLDYLRGSETHLIDTVIKIRAAVGCEHHNPYAICSTCLGKVSENIKDNSNIGHAFVTAFMEMLTQAILSTKHLTQSVKNAGIRLVSETSEYFTIDNSDNLYLRSEVVQPDLQLILPNNKLSKLTDVLNLSHNNISLTKIGELDSITLRYTTSVKVKNDIKVTTTDIPVNISYNDRLSNITMALLEHIKSCELQTDKKGNYCIPIHNFDTKLPMFNCPLKETNTVSFVSKIASIIETTKDGETDGYKKFTHLLISATEQTNCNASILELIAYAVMTRNAKEGDYRLSRNSLTSSPASRLDINANRSLSQLFVYEKQNTAIIDKAIQLLSSNRTCDHPLDVLFAPQEVLSH